jgi:hypothetical protein
MPEIRRRRRRTPRSDKDRSQTGGVWLRWIAPAFLLLLALFGLFGAVQYTVAGLAQLQVQAFLDDWHTRGEVPSAAAAAVAEAAAERRLASYPRVLGEAYEQAALVHEWQAFPVAIGLPEASSSRQRALELYRKAAAERPDWPQAWLGIARMKLDLWEVDAEFQQAFENAHRLGHARFQIHRDLTRIGILGWVALDENQRAMTLESARRTAALGRAERDWVQLHLDWAGLGR